MEDRFLSMKTEATALLIRCGYKVYRPEVDAEGLQANFCRTQTFKVREYR